MNKHELLRNHASRINDTRVCANWDATIDLCTPKDLSEQIGTDARTMMYVRSKAMFMEESLAAKAGEREPAKEEVGEKASAEVARAATKRVAMVFIMDKGFSKASMDAEVQGQEL